ncbi:hypothetical protein DVH24_006877 [Malus domestica]|uniref:30S ribosomal protein S9, chloroplastic n=1 Tax=Malus domestica TaxID=3750 RepID=A0A498JAV5_MALDO|nr:hypothetical protein DVH24_006877 [Malus domestica]
MGVRLADIHLSQTLRKVGALCTGYDLFYMVLCFECSCLSIYQLGDSLDVILIQYGSCRKSSRVEIERQKQEDVAKARVRTLDDKGRAYGTGRRKCSVARVWIQPSNGKFTINDKQFDAYLPMLDHRSALFRPSSKTKTLGIWDINCTVQGGGTTGAVDEDMPILIPFPASPLDSGFNGSQWRSPCVSCCHTQIRMP